MATHASFEYAIKQAAHLGRELNYIALALVGATLASLGVAVALIAAGMRIPFGFTLPGLQVLLGVACIAAATSVALAFYHDFVGRKARLTTDLMADIIQRLIVRGQDAAQDDSVVDAELLLKNRMRHLIADSSLPLVEGRSGPVLYAAVNVGALIISLISLSRAYYGA